MEMLKKEVEDLKNKVLNEIETLSFHKDLKFMVEPLLNELNTYEYDPNNELAVKKYRAFLQDFLETRIALINKLIVSSVNTSVFDNRTEKQLSEIAELEESIESLLSYIKENLPVLGEDVDCEYNRLKNQYNSAIEHTMECTKQKLQNDLTMAEIKEGKRIPKAPVFALYADTSAVAKTYLNHLNAFKSLHVDNIKVFMDNDIQIKEIFKRAYETLKDPRVIAAVKQMEEAYMNKINECLSSDSTFIKSDILKEQEGKIKNGLQLDALIQIEKTRTNYYDQILGMTLNTPLETILDIESYVLGTNQYLDFFYQNIYAIIEKEKYLAIKHATGNLIYNSLNDSTKNAVEKIFLEKLKSLDEDEAYQTIIRYKKEGYLKVLDRQYEKFFNTSEFANHTDYTLESNGSNDKGYTYHYKRSSISALTGNLHISIKTKEGKEVKQTLYNISDPHVSDVGSLIMARYLKVRHGQVVTEAMYYDKQTGKKIEPFTEGCIEIQRQIFGLYVTGTVRSHHIYDKNFKQIYKFENGEDGVGPLMYIDYQRREILLLNDYHYELELFDENFKPIKTIDLNTVLGKFNKSEYILYRTEHFYINDGILTIQVRHMQTKKCYAIIYDLENMKEIDSFQFFNETSLYGYNEGVYNFASDQKFEGYKDLAGNIVIKPTLMNSQPFMGGCAQARSVACNDGFVNKNGDFIPNEYLERNGSKNYYNIDLIMKRYNVVNPNNGFMGFIKTQDNYSIVNDTPIMNIDFTVPTTLTLQ